MKVLLIGNSGVGKSNLLTRFAVTNRSIQENKFSQSMLNTIGVDFVPAPLNIESEIRGQAWREGKGGLGKW